MKTATPCLLVCVLIHSVLTAAEPFDVVITGGRVVDGSGTPWYEADVGIRGGKIAHIGRIAKDEGTTHIDASGLIVAPGFIDMMGQSATPMMLDARSAKNLLTQGITTINAGEGSSAAPLADKDAARVGWSTMAEYLALLDIRGLPVNVAQSVGHTQIRRLVLGDVDRRPSDEELEKMRSLVREAMQAGATGVSTALIYPPAVYATTQEIAELAKVAGQYGGRYYTHMRNEGDQLLEAIDEALEIGRSAKTPVHIFHLKTAGQQNWAKMPQAIARIKAARASGQQVAADVYPYINNGLGIAALIHPRHSAAGLGRLIERLDDKDLRGEIRREMETTDGWENWYRHVGYDWDRVIVGQTEAPKYKQHRGQSVAAIAKEHQQDPWDVFFELVKSGAFVMPQSMSQANKILAMQQEFISYCTDVGPAGGDSFASHPRAFGAFPRLLSFYVRDLGAISLERAIAGASAVAANEIMAYDRGRIAVGLAADVIVFDYQALSDKATLADPQAVSVGMRHVLVAGVPVLKDGELTSAKPGRVLRGPGYKEERAAFKVSTGTRSGGTAAFDELLSDFMRTHATPGLAIAIVNQGQTLAAKGYGYADIATGEPVTSQHLFRIASISKPITAVAILRLVEAGRLSLDDRLVDRLDLSQSIEKAGDKFDPRWRDITLRHLLQHRGGWDRDKSFDAMFQSVRFARQQSVDSPAMPAAIIDSMLTVKLDFAPGERYAYSNFGYCLLGRIIEQITGQPYEQHVRESVLAPLQMNHTVLGRTRIEHRTKNEVRYYQPGAGKSVFQSDLGQEVPLPYGGWNLEAMDAHGGWLSTAEDLARFAAAFDDPEHSPVLSAKMIAEMFARPEGEAGYEKDGKPKDTFYSLGWLNRALPGNKFNRWHTGSLDGTATIMIKRHDGMNMVALLNTRTSPTSSHLGRDIDELLHKAADQLRASPPRN